MSHIFHCGEGCQPPVKILTFYIFQIMTSRNVPSRIFRLADSDNDGHLNVEELMNFLIAVSKPR